MKQQLEEVIAQGYKPIVYIDNALLMNQATMPTIKRLTHYARALKVPVHYSTDTSGLNRLVKAHVFRYGYLPIDTEAMIKRKKGKIVSGNLKVPD